MKYSNPKGSRFNHSSFKDTFRYQVYRNLTISKSVNGVHWWFDSENKWFNWDDAIKLGLLDKTNVVVQLIVKKYVALKQLFVMQKNILNFP